MTETSHTTTPSHTPVPHPISHHGTLDDMAISRYLDPETHPTYIHKEQRTPSYTRCQIQTLRHAQTLCLQQPTDTGDTTHLYLNDDIINLTLQILHQHSPYRSTRHFVPTFFTEQLQSAPDNLHRIHRRLFEQEGGASLNHTFLLIPVHITQLHWTLLVRHLDHTLDTSPPTPLTVSHDSMSHPTDITTT